MTDRIIIFGRVVPLFYLFWLIGVLVAFIVGYSIRKRYGFSFIKCTAYVACDMIFGILLIFGTSWIFGGGSIGSLNFIRIVPFMWIYFALLAWYLKDPYWKVFDMLTIVGAFLFPVARIGCIFSGCCHGYPSEWGLYSNSAGALCFPIQIVEICVALAIALLLLKLSKAKTHQGKIYPYYLVLFGGTRFVLEFWRDNVKLFYGLSELSLFAAASLVMGIAILIYAYRLYSANAVRPGPLTEGAGKNQ